MNGESLTVIKIGGSFLTSHQAMFDIAKLAREKRGAVFVLSAFRGITDRLVSGYGLEWKVYAPNPGFANSPVKKWSMRQGKYSGISPLRTEQDQR